MKLKARIGLIAAAAVAVAVVVVSVGAYFAARNELLDQMDQSLVEVADQARGYDGLLQALGAPTPGRGGRIFQPRTNFDVVYVQALLVPQGNAVFPSSQGISLPIEEEDVAVAEGAPRLLRDVRVEGRHLRMITEQHDFGAIQIARSMEEIDETLSGLTVLLAGVSIGGVILAGGLGLVVARGAMRPVDRLTEAAEHVAVTQELEARIDVDRDDEIGRLADSFNAMLAALEESRRQQRQLVHDAGHELRTPLTALRTNIELLARAGDMPESQRDALLDDVTFELRELSDLVAEIVDLATDASVADEPVADLDLADVVERVASRARRRTGRTITVTAGPHRMMGRRVMLERAVSNLVDNAAKWSPEGGEIAITLDGGRLAVHDAGPGIADEDKDRIFDRFYRAETARSAPGSGLGLSIVKRVAEDHGGEVFVGDAPGGGATVGFTFSTGPHRDEADSQDVD